MPSNGDWCNAHPHNAIVKMGFYSSSTGPDLVFHPVSICIIHFLQWPKEQDLLCLWFWNLATSFNSVRRKIFDKEGHKTSFFATLNKGVAAQNPYHEHMNAFLRPNRRAINKGWVGVGTFSLHGCQSWNFGVTEPYLRWKSPEILNYMWRLQTCLLWPNKWNDSLSGCYTAGFPEGCSRCTSHIVRHWDHKIRLWGLSHEVS